MLRKLLKITLAVIIAASVAGCRSNKGASGSGVFPGGDTIVAGSAGEVQMASLPKRYELLTNTWKPWRDLEMGVKFQLRAPVKINAAGKIWMKRGEWISISVRMIGIEVATLWLDKDSVVAVDKYHKKYLSEPTAQLLGSAGVTISDIQDLLLGRAFLASDGLATPRDVDKFDFEQAKNGWFLLPREQPAAFNYGFLASDNSSELRGAIVEVKDFGSVSAKYGDAFQSRGCGWFAPDVSIETSRGKRIEAKLIWDINGARFNGQNNRSCKIPEDYTKISSSALIKTLKSF